MLNVRNISKNYGKEKILDDLSFDIDKGECLALLGPSGSGKTTCLKLINRLIELDSGSIFFRDRDIYELDLIYLRKNISYLFQKGLLFPHLTVKENIELAIHDIDAQHVRDRRINHLLNIVDLAATKEQQRSFLDRYPHELSGGQAQRVALAQAMSLDPKILLLDEPFNGLDRKTKDSLMAKLLEIKKAFGLAMILVTHEAYEAEFLADKVLEL